LIKAPAMINATQLLSREIQHSNRSPVAWCSQLLKQALNFFPRQIFHQ
jgi:hypothetical protein